MPLKDSTRRSIRTLYQAFLAALVVIPVVAVLIPVLIRDLFPEDSPVTKITVIVCGGMVTATVAFTKLHNALEAKGLIPTWLKIPAATPRNPDPEGPAV